MEKLNRLLLALICLVGAGTFAWASVIQNSVMPMRVETISEASDGLTAEFSFIEPEPRLMGDEEDGYRLWFDMPGSVVDFDAEGPALPAFTRLIAVPDGYTVRFRIVSKTESEFEAEEVIPRDEMRRTLRRIESLPAVEVGEPGWMRYLRVAPVVIHPARYNEQEHRLYSIDRMTVEFEFVPDGEFSDYTPDPDRYWSLAFDELFRVLLLNQGVLTHIIPDGKVVRRGSYLIITDDTLMTATPAFADWKRSKGFNVVVEPMYYHGIPADEIRDYIRDAYENWDRPPEFVLLLGDENQTGIRLPSFTMENPGHPGDRSNVTDLPYVLLQGDDYFPDAFVGRISCDSPSLTDARKVLTRTLDYEQNPDDMFQENFRNATLFAGNYGDGNNRILSPVETTEWLAERLIEKGFDVERFYYRSGEDDISPGPIVESIDRGVNIVSYRGWADARGTHFPQFYRVNLEQLTNEQPLPVFTFFVCRTGDFGNDDHITCFGESAIIRGSLINPHGAIAFYGSSDLHTSTRFNNPMLAGYYTGLLYNNIRTLGPLTLRAKMEVWRGFPHQRNRGGQDNYVEFYFHCYNILGDPELNVYLDAPYQLNVTHPERLAVGESHTRFVVRAERGDPIRGALVNLKKGDETEISMLTDHLGVALIPVNLNTPGELEITVLAHQATPYQAVIPVENAGQMVGLADVIVNNQFGDDRLVTGSPMEISIALRNTGNQPASSVTGVLSSSLAGVAIGEIIVHFGDIAAGETAAGGSAFPVSIEPRVAYGTYVPFELSIADGGGNHYQALFRLPAVSAALQYNEYAFTNGVINPGDTDNLVMNVTNYGPIDLSGVRAELHCFDEAVEVLDAEAVFGDIPSREMRDCSGDPFRIRVQDQAANGRNVALRTLFYDNQDRMVGRIFFDITVGELDSSDPQGPDAYGYYAYDNTDDERYSPKPTYDWIELDPDHGGENADHHPLEDDASFVMDLPFTFCYYGMDFESITICSNGWFSFEETWMWNFRNWSLPSPLGPHTLVAPYWEDLVGQSVDQGRAPLDIFTWFDEDENRFVIEWSRVVARTSVGDVNETFEAILYNPAVYNTPTGDGEIVFQYLEAELVDRNEGNYATVGIEDWNHFRGLQVTFAGEYAIAAEPLGPERAIKITTIPPDPYQGISKGIDSVPTEFSLDEPYPNPFNSQTRLSFSLPCTGPVKLTLWSVNGRLLRTLSHDHFNAGKHSITLVAGDLPSGLYLVKLDNSREILQHKVLLIR